MEYNKKAFLSRVSRTKYEKFQSEKRWLCPIDYTIEGSGVLVGENACKPCQIDLGRARVFSNQRRQVIQKRRFRGGGAGEN